MQPTKSDIYTHSYSSMYMSMFKLRKIATKVLMAIIIEIIATHM